MNTDELNTKVSADDSVHSNNNDNYQTTNQTVKPSYVHETRSSNEEVDDTDFVNNDSLVSKRMTIAGGFLDFALLSANVEHMKFVIEAGLAMKHYELLLTLLIISILLQLFAGVLLFMSGFRKTTHITKTQASMGSKLNQSIIGVVSIIAVINVFITIFGDRASAIIEEQRRLRCLPNNVANLNETFNE